MTLRIDPDILAWFEEQASEYQTRINAALRLRPGTPGEAVSGQPRPATTLFGPRIAGLSTQRAAISSA